MAWLLIDNSNNRTKFGIGHKNGLTNWRKDILTAELNHKVLQSTLQDISYDFVTISSVVPWATACLEDFFQGKPVHKVSYQSPLDYDCKIPEPEKIGADRLVNLTALKHKYGFPSVAIDFGTAVTFSILSENGDFIGGAIAPGMDAMLDYLPDKTALLPRISLNEPRTAIGQNTTEAILAGAVYGQRGMVNGILTEIISAMNSSIITVVATGGGALIGFKNDSPGGIIDLNLTLEGIRLVTEKLHQNKMKTVL